jgi:hypothetical protein
MVSKKKVAANRRNAKKSTGPKTAAGKRKVAKNALVHGLRSQRWPVLPYEDAGEYHVFAESVERDLKPVGIVQREIVEHITQLLWKLRRIPAIEHAILVTHKTSLDEALKEKQEEGEMEGVSLDALTTPMLIAADFIRADGIGYERLEKHRGRLERGLHAAMRRLRDLRKETVGEELPLEQQGRYEFEEFERVVDEHHEANQKLKQMQEAENKNGANKATAIQDADNSRPDKEKQLELRTGMTDLVSTHRGMGVSPMLLDDAMHGRDAHATKNHAENPAIRPIIAGGNGF